MSSALIYPFGREPGQLLELHEYWVGKIRDIRAASEAEVWTRVQWYYSGREAKMVVKSFDDKACTQYERLYSDQFNYVSTLAFSGVALLHKLIDSDLKQPYIPWDEFYVRYAFEVSNALFNPAPGKSSCVCDVPYAPHSYTINSKSKTQPKSAGKSTVRQAHQLMHYCPRPSCRRFFHVPCLINEGCEDPDTGAASRARRLLCAAPDVDGDIFAVRTRPLGKGMGPETKRVRLGTPLDERDNADDNADDFVFPSSTVNTVPVRGAGRGGGRRGRPKRSGPSHPQPPPALSSEDEEDDDDLELRLQTLPPDLVRVAEQPIVRGIAWYAGGVSGNVAAVVAARRIVYAALGLSSALPSGPQDEECLTGEAALDRWEEKVGDQTRAIVDLSNANASKDTKDLVERIAKYSVAIKKKDRNCADLKIDVWFVVRIERGPLDPAKRRIFPANPVTTRGASTRLSASKDKVIYTIGKTVVIRDLNNPLLSKTYSGHVHNVTVARFSPSGYYCASADANGTVKVWDTVGEDQSVKGEYRVLSGRINDLAWDGESKRIIAVGEGRDKFGHAFMMDTGTSSGSITGHAKTIKTHTKFVQDVRYAPSGDHFVSVGSDAKAFLYDGKTGDTLSELSTCPHTGSIMAVAWSPDSKNFVTSSADRTVVLWDVQTEKPVTTWTLGSGIPHQQVGNTWCGEQDIVSLSLSGSLNIFDPRSGAGPSRILDAPQKPVNALTPVSSSTFLGGTADGRVLSFSSETGETALVPGETHTNLISNLASSPTDGTVYSVGYDDRLREISVNSSGASFSPSSVPIASQPKSLAIAGDGTVFVAEINSVEAFRSNQRVFEHKPKVVTSAVAAFQGIVALGGEDKKVRLNAWDGKSLTETTVLDGNRGVISALAFSPDGKFLASGDMITSRWSFHSARINSLAWTSDSLHCASASLDTHVYVWSVENPMKNIAITNAAPGGANAVHWLENSVLATTGADGCVSQTLPNAALAHISISIYELRIAPPLFPINHAAMIESIDRLMCHLKLLTMSHDALFSERLSFMSSDSDTVAVAAPPAPIAKERPFSRRFCDPSNRHERRLYLEALIIGTLMVCLTIFAIFPIYWGSLWKTPERPLKGWVVDFDGGIVGQYVSQQLITASSTTKVTFTAQPSSKYPGGPDDLANDVVNQRTWVAVTINPGASSHLQASYTNPNASYNGMGAMTMYAAEARNENAYRIITRPVVGDLLNSVQASFAIQAAHALPSSTLLNVIATSPQTIIQPIYFVIDNVRAFNEPVAAAVTFVGLIYVCILSFFVVAIAYGAREGCGLNRNLTYRSLVITRLVTSAIAYFVVSLFYSLLTLAFQLNFTRK
ncbi:hypothetical protein H0H92_015879 [Tricholoma furcatifolium]|nr:hypothetical protein H0H92_015879 [Tricholoma furcatifolium]